MVSDFLRKEIIEAFIRLRFDPSKLKFDISPGARFGDFETNAAFCYADAGKKPLETARALLGELFESKSFSDYVDRGRTEVAGPGLINFFLSDRTLKGEVEDLEKNLIGGFDFISGRKINIEFVSLNPTGELHVGHGRGAFYGDCLANIFSFSGAKVDREYLINNSRESKQIMELGKTALGKGSQYKTPELESLMRDMDFSGLDETEAGFKLAEKIQENNREFIVEKLGIRFDKWFSEETELRASGKDRKMLETLKDKNLIYEKEGASWLKTSEYGDDEDRVVIRSDGSVGYILPDIAYHAEKLNRGSDEVIDIWGADHQGHVKKIRAAGKMLGWPESKLIIFIAQMVSLKGNGVSAKMSKRSGNVILLHDLVDEFGLDTVRWFFSDKSLNTHMEFDMALAKEHSAKNPVFYVQYAHARISSILEKAKSAAPDGSEIADTFKEPAARTLAVKIIEFPEIISSITEDYQVHKLTTYAYELASSFAQFYEKVRIVSGISYNAGALTLATVAKETLAKSLNLLGISAPNKM